MKNLTLVGNTILGNIIMELMECRARNEAEQEMTPETEATPDLQAPVQ